MYVIFSDEVKKLEKEVEPWIVGREGANKDFAPIFKKNTPQDILKKYDRLCDLIRAEAS